jgi:hypothetical protein
MASAAAEVLFWPFLNAVDKAKESCKTISEAVYDHFVDVNKMVGIGYRAERQQDDIIRSFSLSGINYYFYK